MIWWERPVAEPEAAQREEEEVPPPFIFMLRRCREGKNETKCVCVCLWACVCVCVCVCVRRGVNIKNNCCLSHLWLNEIWWRLLLLLMWPRLRYYCCWRWWHDWIKHTSHSEASTFSSAAEYQTHLASVCSSVRSQPGRDLHFSYKCRNESNDWRLWTA